MNTSNLKDTVTTISGLVGTVAGAVLASGLPLSPTVKSILGLIVAISVGLIGYFTGKTPSGANKTNNQLGEQNKSNP